jgi:hypothetical protein
MNQDLVLSDWIQRPTTASGWSDLTTCAARTGVPSDACGRVELSYVGRSGLAATVTAVRRAGPAR